MFMWALTAEIVAKTPAKTWVVENRILVEGNRKGEERVRG